jgi:sugar lactone lactonase YvrE
VVGGLLVVLGVVLVVQGVHSARQARRMAAENALAQAQGDPEPILSPSSAVSAVAPMPPVATPTPPRPFRIEPVPAPAAPSPESPRKSGPLVFKRRHDLGEEELRRFIEKVPEITLDRTKERTEMRDLVAAQQRLPEEKRHVDAGSLLAVRPDLAGLPLRMGDECKIGPVLALHLQQDAVILRGVVEKVTSPTAASAEPAAPQTVATPAELLSQGPGGKHWSSGESVPALNQVLMAENETIRTLLVEQLAKVEGKKATQALAQRALFDLHPEVRKHAVEGLQSRPREDYAATLLEGFRHPWAAIANHAAEAIVALQLHQAVPSLVRLLEEPDPALAWRKPGTEDWQVRELVRLNHFKNCLVCHAPSFDGQDRVRGPVPRLDQSLAAPRAYYNSPGDIFVRADVTYLRQDFSAPLAVADHGPWPAVQRFDFVVRQREATALEIDQALKAARNPTVSEHQRALLFALRELTGTDTGPAIEDAKALFLDRNAVPEVLPISVSVARDKSPRIKAVAVDARGNALLVDEGTQTLLRQEGRDFVSAARLPGACTGLTIDSRGRLIATLGAAGQIVSLDSLTGSWEVLAGKKNDPPLENPSHPVADALGGVYFTTGQTVAYLSARGNVTKVDADSLPVALALAPDGRWLYVLDGLTQTVKAIRLEGAGLLEKASVLCRLPATDEQQPGGGLAVDRIGNLYAIVPGHKSVQVFNREGARLGTIALSAQPLSCAVSSGQTRVLVVTTTEGVYRVQLDGGAERTASVR